MNLLHNLQSRIIKGGGNGTPEDRTISKLRTLSGQDVSRLCFGAMQFGGAADEGASRSMYDACRASGINFFDTAHVYNEGRAERLLGSFASADRKDVLIATKVGYSGGSGRTNVMRQFEESRRRLGLDIVDILYLHRWDDGTELEETFDTLAELKAAGAIRYIGVSNFAAWQIMKAQAVAWSRGLGIDIIQPMYSLIKRQAEVEIFPMALSEGFAVASYSPLAAGLLTGKYESGGTGRLTEDPRYGARYGQSWMRTSSENFAKLANENGVPPATMAVAWVAHNPAVTAPIISARNLDQLTPSLAALEYELTDDLYERIGALSPRPAPATDRLEEASV